MRGPNLLMVLILIVFVVLVVGLVLGGFKLLDELFGLRDW